MHSTCGRLAHARTHAVSAGTPMHSTCGRLALMPSNCCGMIPDPGRYLETKHKRKGVVPFYFRVETRFSPSTVNPAPSTEHRQPSTVNRAPSTEHRWVVKAHFKSRYVAASLPKRCAVIVMRDCNVWCTVRPRTPDPVEQHLHRQPVRDPTGKPCKPHT